MLVAIISLLIFAVILGYVGCDYISYSFTESISNTAENIKLNRRKKTKNKLISTLKPELYLLGTDELKAIRNNEIAYNGKVLNLSEIRNLKIKTVVKDDEGFEEFPIEIFKFLELEYLWIGMRGFKEIPIGLSGLKKLRSINIQHGAIEKLPSDIIYLQNLESLNLLWSNISELPPKFSNLRMLKYLNLGCTQLEKVSPELLKMKGLETIILSHDDECQEIREVFDEIDSDRIRRELKNTKIRIGRKMTKIEVNEDSDFDLF